MEKYCYHDWHDPMLYPVDSCGKPRAPYGLCMVMADSHGTHCEVNARWRIIAPWDELLTCPGHLQLGLGEMITPTSDGRVVVEYYNE
jgi:hypothetical protein